MKLTPFDTKKIYEPSNNLIEFFWYEPIWLH
jgi:hypothetical protein